MDSFGPLWIFPRIDLVQNKILEGDLEDSKDTNFHQKVEVETFLSNDRDNDGQKTYGLIWQ